MKKPPLAYAVEIACVLVTGARITPDGMGDRAWHYHAVDLGPAAVRRVDLDSLLLGSKVS